VRTFEELEALFTARPVAPTVGSLKLIVIRRTEGAHETPPRGRLDLAEGLEGDRWARDATPARDSQVTLMNSGVAELVAAGVQPLDAPGDNLLVDVDLSVAALPVGSRVRVGDAVVEVTAQPHLGCYKFAARFGQDALRWINWLGHRERRLRGVNCRIVESGAVAVGDPVEILVT
jgi:MOSC domain-containing protein YiiM